MRPGNLQSSAGRIQDALDVLLQRWEQTREVWRDSRAQHFEDEVIRPLRDELAIATPAIGHMSQILSHAQRELEE